MPRIILSIIFLLLASAAFACGKERWPVKVGTDRDAVKVDVTPQSSNIAALATLHAPPHPLSRKNSRFAIEFKTYEISGVLTLIKKEADEDYHLVITDPDDDEATMIVESPSPNCARGSVFLDQIKAVRKVIDGKLAPVRGKKHPNVAVTAMGVAFFDPIHGQEGVAENGIELHPLLGIVFK